MRAARVVLPDADVPATSTRRGRCGNRSPGPSNGTQTTLTSPHPEAAQAGDPLGHRTLRGYLLPTKVTGVGPGSGVVLGGTLSLRLPAGGERGSSMACGLAGHRGEAWLKRGLLGS